MNEWMNKQMNEQTYKVVMKQKQEQLAIKNLKKISHSNYLRFWIKSVQMYLTIQQIINW